MGLSLIKDGVVGVGFNGGMDLFSGGFKVVFMSGVGSNGVGFGVGVDMFLGS